MNRSLLVCLFIAVFIMHFAGATYAIEPVGISVAIVDEASYVERCPYCGKIIKQGPVHRDADLIVMNALKETLAENGIAYSDGKDTKMTINVYIYRFIERQGGNFAVEKPASVGFHMHLMEGPMVGKTFEFDEKQKPLSQNILEFRKFVERGGKWVTASQLASEGIKQGVMSFQEVLAE